MSRRHPDSLIFDTIRLEGSLFVPALLEKVARGEHSEQAAPDYQLPKGLSLADEQGRAFRIAGALWKHFGPVRARKDVDALKTTIGFAQNSCATLSITRTLRSVRRPLKSRDGISRSPLCPGAGYP